MYDNVSNNEMLYFVPCFSLLIFFQCKFVKYGIMHKVISNSKALDVDTILTTSTTSSDPLEFLGPEMADLQQLLSTIMSGNLHFTHVNM
jgi:hypothetical protein